MATRHKNVRQQHPKRHGKHQKHTHHFLKVYAPYLPLLSILGVLIFSSGPWLALKVKSHGVLAYAADSSVSGLLAATNQQRAANGQTALSLNSKLNQAAQAKANDMAARDYWSHVTPDGQQPWYFFNQAGYSYQKAGENLAYGFDDSSDTVTGWMNSPPHRENLLDSAFTDVGFGIANNPNYQNSGPETIVVAEYGEPQVQAAETPAPTPAPPAATVPTTPKASPPAPTPTPVLAATPTPAPDPTPASSSTPLQTSQPATATTASAAEPPPHKISYIQSLTSGQAPWSNFAVGTVIGITVAFLIIKHALGLKRLILSGERFVLHHPLLDTTLISLVTLGLVLSRTAGIIR